MYNLFINLFLINIYINLSNENIITNENETIETNRLRNINIHPSNSAVNKKNLIFSIIQKYSLKKVLPFFNSLLKSDFKNCDIVIFVRNVGKKLINYLKKIGVFVFEIPKKYKKVRIINLRWRLYINFLEINKNLYNFVFHCDIRDTFFQKDVFKYFSNHEPYLNYKSFLGVTLEDDTLNEKIDKKWIIDYVGEEKHKIIQNERIICVGTMWGTIDKFLEFSIAFWEKLKESPKSIEQGIANYMFYYEKFFEDCIIKNENNGPVMTIGLTKNEKLNFDSQDNILNFNGEIACVIHQYDRKPYIVEKVINKYCPELIELKNKIIFIYTLNKGQRKSNALLYLF
jgi:hypothetical protein